MADYTRRGKELKDAIDALQPKPPEDVAAKLRRAVDDYVALRAACLVDLINLVTDESTSNRDNAARWRDRCSTMRGAVQTPFDNASNSVSSAPDDVKTAVNAWKSVAVMNEEKFFETLSKVNVAEVRDYLVENAVKLESYTKALDERWRKITADEKGVRSEEQKLYQDMLASVRKVIAELATSERTFQEKVAQVAAANSELAKEGYEFTKQFVAALASNEVNLPSKYAEWMVQWSQRIENWITSFFPSQISDAHAKIMQLANEWMARVATYERLVQIEKAGILPFFKETRKEVYEFWRTDGSERAEAMIKSARESLDRWLSDGSPTAAQKEEAKSFCELAYNAAGKHIDKVKSIARAFEDRWEGVFKGPFKVTTMDELVDAETWRMNARTLVEASTFACVDAYFDHLNMYYENSFAESLSELETAMRQLPPVPQAEALRIVGKLKELSEREISARIKALRDQAKSSLAPLGNDQIKKLFDRSGLEGWLKES
jgi:hypothetical protein